MDIPGVQLGAIADDFTGATDLAASLARSGQPVSLRLGVPTEAPLDPSPIEVVALKIRTSPVAQATAEALAALEWLRSAGAERYYWKYCSTFDSTPEGNIGPVAEALMVQLGAGQTVYCPAFPENGRTVYLGHLFVGGEPLDESPMKDHPLTPMGDSSLVRLLEPQVTGPVGLIDWPTVAKGAEAIAAQLADLAARGVANVVVDAIADGDLAQIVEGCRGLPLLTGGSALAVPLPGLGSGRGRPARAAPIDWVDARFGPGAVVLSGSASAMSNAQVASYRATGRPAFRLDPRDLAEIGSSAVVHWLEDQDLGQAPLIYSTAEPEVVRSVQRELGRERAAELVEEALADCARAAAAAGARRFVVAGGETSGAVAEALGITRLELGPEICSGVPWCSFARGEDTAAIALKSGNFGTASFFSDALELLDRRR